MALATPALETSIKLLLEDLLKIDNPNSKDISSAQREAIDKFASDLSTAIETFVKSGQVNPGIPVSTTGTPTAQTGATIGPGTIS